MASQNRRPRKPSRTTKLNAQDRVLFCAATGIDHAAVGIVAHAMQSMAVRGFIAHNRESGAFRCSHHPRIVGSHHRVVDLDQRQLQLR